jgi:hypothetical protein
MLKFPLDTFDESKCMKLTCSNLPHHDVSELRRTRIIEIFHLISYFTVKRISKKSLRVEVLLENR